MRLSQTVFVHNDELNVVVCITCADLLFIVTGTAYMSRNVSVIVLKYVSMRFV